MASSHNKLSHNGLIDRRSFLRSGATLLTAVASAGLSPPRAAQDFSRYPRYMTTPGRSSDSYGLPSQYESQVKRKKKQYYQSKIFTEALTPLQDLRGIITPNGLHFCIHHNGIPDIPPDKHRFMIHGLVDKPLKWNMADLLRYPMISRVQFLECSGNSAANATSDEPVQGNCMALHGQISCAEWTGIPLSVLLNEVGIKSKARWAMCEGADAGSQVRNIPIEKLLDDAIIALYQNGERLRPDQGYPMRLFLPGYEGNANIKWLHRMELSDQPSQSKDEQSLYAEFDNKLKIRQFTLYMEVKSVITHPSGLQQLPDKGYYEISGLAWSGRGKINTVEVSADGGNSWLPATLQGPTLSKAFTRFTLPWQWQGQSARLISRAIDEYGNTQPSRKEWKSRFANFTFNHYNAMQIWEVTREGRINNAYS